MNANKVSMFIIITYAISWTIILIAKLMDVQWNTPLSIMITAGYMFVPMLAALFVQKIIFAQPIKSAFGISFKVNKFWIISWLLPLFIAIGALGVGLLLPGVHFSPDLSGVLEKYKNILPPEQLAEARAKIADFKYHPSLIVIGQTGMGMLAGASINAIAAFGEEAGWRGLLYNELKNLNFWASSWLIGFIWGLWHFPIILLGHNYPMHPEIGVLFMILMCMLYSPIINYIRMKSKSVIASAIFHGTLNGTAALPIMLTQGGSDLTVGIQGVAGLIFWGIVNIVLYFIKRIPKT